MKWTNWTTTWSRSWLWFRINNLKLYTETGRYYEFLVFGVFKFAFAIHFGGPAKFEEKNANDE